VRGVQSNQQPQCKLATTQLPERIANGVIDMNSEWLSARTVGEALTLPLPIDVRDKEVIE
jgi:hypothetical protein